MIKIDSLEVLYSHLAKILFYGISNDYSLDFIEEALIDSDFFNQLENGNDDFLYNTTIVNIVDDIYSVRDENYDFNNINGVFVYIGEAYMRLFFKYHKSIEYLFLYLPLKKMINLYDLYHELDFSYLYQYFEEQINKRTLLKSLIKKKELSVNKLSKLTGISSSTLNYYLLDDNHLYEARFTYIESLSYVLKVKINIFLKEIHNYTDSSTYDFDKYNEFYRNYLGLYLAEYYSQDIEERNYHYDDKIKSFVSGKQRLIVSIIESNEIAEISNKLNEEILDYINNISKQYSEEERKRINLIIFEFNQISKNPKVYKNLSNYKFDKIFIVNNIGIITVDKKSSRMNYPSDSINEIMITKAKKKVGEDFAL